MSLFVSAESCQGLSQVYIWVPCLCALVAQFSVDC